MKKEGFRAEPDAQYKNIKGESSNGVQGVQTRLKRKDRFESK